jgi:hypothetical protein
VRRLVLAGTITMTGLGGAVLVARPAAAAGTTLTVSTTGTDSGNCQGASCATLGYALSQAASGDTIVIDSGTFRVTADPTGTSNTVPAALSGLTIESSSGVANTTVIDGTNAVNGLVVNANDVTVENLTVENTGAAGIMVSPPPATSPPATVSGDTILDDVVNDSDQCELNPSTVACTAAVGPGDYGESMWLRSVTGSTVEGNTLEGGLAGGMLLSDELGPNHGNFIYDNAVVRNSDGCGITLAAHNAGAIFSSGPDAGQPDPAVGGVFDNTVEANYSENNGANGIGLFNVAYDNTVESNFANGNGGPGIEIDDDVPGADLNGNAVVDNIVDENSLLGGPGGDSPGQHTVHTTQTTGIMVIARFTPVTGTVIGNNTIDGDFYGIWMSALGSSATLTDNAITANTGGVAVFVSPTLGTGYWALGADGGVFSFGQAPEEGSTGAMDLGQPVVGMAATPDAGGYWLAARDGSIFGFGDAGFYGSVPSLGVKVSDMVGIAATPDGGGYWMVGSDGGVFSFGDAGYFGSLPGLGVRVSDIVGITATPDGGGYWMVAKDGGVFGFGDARYLGSLPGLGVATAGVVGMAATPDGAGYRLVGSDGGVFAFGDARYLGSLPGLGVATAGVVGMATSPDGAGYWMVAKDGGVFGFGDARYLGSLPGLGVAVSDVTGMVSAP